MLETLQDFNEVQNRLSEDWQLMERVVIEDLPSGTLIWLFTRSEASYLLEVVDPIKTQAHVVRLEASRPDLRAGYRGLRKVSSPITIGEQVTHGEGSMTSPVGQILVLVP